MRTVHDNAMVYLVDDEFAVRDSLSLLIESAGFNIQSFESALDFLDCYDPQRPGCLLLDVRMPAMSGLELQEELSNRKISIPIIFISGQAEISDTRRLSEPEPSMFSKNLSKTGCCWNVSRKHQQRYL